MKKIMFNDYYGLTKAVLDGSKTQTRRIAPKNTPLGCWKETEAKAHFKVGEIVAIAQSYRDIWQQTGYMTATEAKQCAGYSNKMFVRADLMPHQIRITNVRVERLQEISDEDCLKEGVVKIVHRIPTEAEQYITRYYPCQYLKDCADDVGWGLTYATPQQAYAHLIDAISGKETWASNSHVFVYDFELIK